MTQRHFKSHLFFCFFFIFYDKESNEYGEERTGQNSNLGIVEPMGQITKGQVGYEERHGKANSCEASSSEEVGPSDVFCNSDEAQFAGDETNGENPNRFSDG